MHGPRGNPSDAASEQVSKRRPLQFRLRTAFLVVTAFGAALGLLRGFLLWGGAAGGVMLAIVVVFVALQVAILRAHRNWAIGLALLFFFLLILLLATLAVGSLRPPAAPRTSNSPAPAAAGTRKSRIGATSPAIINWGRV